MKKFLTLSFIVAVIGIGSFVIFKKPVSPLPPGQKPPMEEIGKCGDNICDELEKANPSACPADCKSLPSNVSLECDLNNDGKVDSFEGERCEQKTDESLASESSSSETYKCPQYTPPAPSFYENCENKGGTVKAGEKNDKGCQMPPQCVVSGKSLSSSSSSKISSSPAISSSSSKSSSKPSTSVTKSTASVTVDASQSLGKFSPYLFANNTTGPKAVELGFKLTLSGGVPPMANKKDANDSSNYSFFTETDKVIKETFNSGLEPMIMFSLPSPEKESDSETFFSQQYFEQFSLYVKKVATHLRDTKWPNNGKVKAVRFGNEPDFNFFFKGAQMDYFKSYETFAKALKSVDPNFIIDAPAFAIRQIDDEKSWTKDFLSYIDKKGAYLDIFDVHVYSPSPNEFYNQFKSLKEELSKYPKLSNLYGTPAMGSNEWNFLLEQSWTGKYHKQFDTAWHSSFSIASLINMIEQGVVLSVPINLINPNDQDYGLIHSNGNGKPSYYAFKGFNQLAGTNRLSISGTDRMNFAAISGKSDNGVIVVISNYDMKTYWDTYKEPDPENAPQGKPSDYKKYISEYGEPKVYDKYTLNLNNLPWNSSDKVTYERYIVDDNKKLELTETKTVSGGNTLTFTKDISAPSVEVVKVYKK